MEESLGAEQDRAAGPVIHRAKSVEESSTRPPSLKARGVFGARLLEAAGVSRYGPHALWR
jgi:hypothetical protein